MARRPCCCRTVFVILGFLRVMGGFPYSCRYKGDRLEVKKSPLAIIWTFLVVSTMMTLSVSCIVHAPNGDDRKTDEISVHILNYITYGVSALFFPYIALRSPRLARAIARMDEANLQLGRRALGQADYVHIVCYAGVILGTCYTSYISVLDLSGLLNFSARQVLYHIPATLCDPIFDITAISLIFLLYFLFKVLSLETEDAVMSKTQISKDRLETPEVAETPRRSASYSTLPLSTSRVRPRAPASLKTVSATCEATQKPSPDAFFATSTTTMPIQCEVLCRVASRRLLMADDLVVEVVDYAGPPVAMILLSSTVNATVMLYLTITILAAGKLSTYYMAYIGVKVLSVVQVTFVPDSLLSKVLVPSAAANGSGRGCQGRL